MPEQNKNGDAKPVVEALPPNFDPMGSIAKNPIRGHLPVGTLEEVKALGLNPDEVGTCHHHDDKGIRGCHVALDCPFVEERVCGYRGPGSTNFKYLGPQMVGYFIQTSKADGSRVMENDVPCYVFTSTLLERQRTGESARMRRKDHELIQIVALEGDGETITKREIVAVNPELSQKGIDIREKTLPPRELPVMHFPRPGENAGRSYDQVVRRRQLERKNAAAAAFVPRSALKKQVDEFEDDSLSPAVEVETEADAPPQKRRGRPPGSRNVQHADPE